MSAQSSAEHCLLIFLRNVHWTEIYFVVSWTYYCYLSYLRYSTVIFGSPHQRLLSFALKNNDNYWKNIMKYFLYREQTNVWKLINPLNLKNFMIKSILSFLFTHEPLPWKPFLVLVLLVPLTPVVLLISVWFSFKVNNHDCPDLLGKIFGTPRKI